MLIGLKLTRTAGGVVLSWSTSGGLDGVICAPTMEELAEHFGALLWRLAAREELPPPPSDEDIEIVSSGVLGRVAAAPGQA